MICTISQQTDGPTQKWEDIKRCWHLPKGPSIVPWMRPPVLRPEADCHLEHLSIHHMCHHPQETWEAESRTAEVVFFYRSWDSYCWKCSESSAAGFAVFSCLLFYWGGVCRGKVWLKLAILHRTESSIKRKVKERKLLKKIRRSQHHHQPPCCKTRVCHPQGISQPDSDRPQVREWEETLL